MEGNIVKAAWVLGGSIIGSVVIGGGGLLLGLFYLAHNSWEQLDAIAKRSADAVQAAPRNTTVHFDGNSPPIKLGFAEQSPVAVRFDKGDGSPIKVGFEQQLPVAVRLENSLDEHNQSRAAFQVDLKPNFEKDKNKSKD